MTHRMLLCAFILCANLLSAQTNRTNIDRPKLVIGIVIDQMRYDFLFKFQDRYSKDGFIRLLHEGHSCENMMINYLPSFTAPGHAAIYTGSIPSIHGIAGNNWIDKITGNQVYCTDDPRVHAVGGTIKAGKMSPSNMLTSTITDELRLATDFESKSFAVSLKDRGAILPGGHTANTAYWMDDSAGVFMSSSFYINALPQWVVEFNHRNLAQQYLKNNWNTLYPIEQYPRSINDGNKYEGKFNGESLTSFPHKTSSLALSEIRKTPFGNTIVFDFAKELIQNEKLGTDATTDFLCLSLSSTDYIGHQFGPDAIETEDTYLRLDRDLSNFMKLLDEKVGKGNYTVFLTADHGVAHNPQYLIDHKIPAGFSFSKQLNNELNTFLNQRFGSNRLIRQVEENHIWLNHEAIDSMHLDEAVLRAALLKTLAFHPEIMYVADMNNISNIELPQVIKEMVVNGYNRKRSGDILILLNPGWLDAYAVTGTTHGAWNPYDVHIPMLWYGWGIKKGKTLRTTHITDIAPTLASLLHIQMPNGCIGNCIAEVIR